MENIDPKKIAESFFMIHNPDGTFTRRLDIYPIVPPSITDLSSPSLSKDIPLNSDKSTWVRIYLPRSLSEKKKLPILIYVHGSGFVVASAAQPNFHDFCSYAGSSLPALVVSVEYHLAPEHRLPAAYEDVLDALNWVKEGKEKWVEEYGDLSRCVMMGDSAGGNIVGSGSIFGVAGSGCA